MLVSTWLAPYLASTMLRDDVVHDTDRDHFMSAAEACTWGLIDKVLDPKKA